MVRNPQEDFKNILDEAERMAIREKEAGGKEKQEQPVLNSQDEEEMKEPATQSSGPTQGSESSSQPSEKSNNSY